MTTRPSRSQRESARGLSIIFDAFEATAVATAAAAVAPPEVAFAYMARGEIELDGHRTKDLVSPGEIGVKSTNLDMAKRVVVSMKGVMNGAVTGIAFGWHGATWCNLPCVLDADEWALRCRRNHCRNQNDDNDAILFIVALHSLHCLQPPRSRLCTEPKKERRGGAPRVSRPWRHGVHLSIVHPYRRQS